MKRLFPLLPGISAVILLSLVAFSTISISKSIGPVALVTDKDLSANATYEKALSYLHNFEYDEAAELFIEAQKKQPEMALAYWGEAMTYDHPIWGDLDIDKSRAALQRLAATPEQRSLKCKTQIEKDYIKSVEILFGEGSKPDRQQKYAEFMSTLYKKYPGNHDVAAFYALSLLGVKKGWNEWENQNVEAARLATEVLTADPNHPGALHYLVHANDHPLHAKDGLEAANKYAVVASYAGHALHMPSHIYLALGMWSDVVRSNEVSWKASVDSKEKKKLSNDEYSYHSHLWLQYGYLQQGRFAKAKEILQNQLRFTNELPSAAARVHLLQMKGHYLFETNDWSSPIADIAIKTEDLMTAMQYNAVMIEGYRAFQSNDVARLETIVEQFDEKLNNDSQLQKANEKMTICGVTRFAKAVPTVQEVQSGKKLLKRLQGMHAWLKNDPAKAEEYLRESLPKEGSVVIGPLFSLISSYELYGRFLLSANRPEDAFEQFSKALAASPNRLLSLTGQLKASRMMNDSEKEKAVLAQLEKNLVNADPDAKNFLKN
jgi:Tfp pilus assembly protein PilF